MTRLYHVDAVSEKTGRRTRMTAYPVPHREALTIRGNLMDRPDVRRLVLTEETAPCDCGGRSWYGTYHDSACPLAGAPRPDPLA